MAKAIADRTLGLGSIAGVLIADYWVVRDKRLALPDLYLEKGEYTYSRGWNWRAVVATVAGFGEQKFRPGNLLTARNVLFVRVARSRCQRKRLFGRLEFVGKEIFVGVRSVAELFRLLEGFGSRRAGRHILGHHHGVNCFGIEVAFVGRGRIALAHDILRSYPSKRNRIHAAGVQADHVNFPKMSTTVQTVAALEQCCAILPTMRC